jgi:predicted DCC family thiol-disulfide oxidoreductase YuxK
MDIEQLNFDFGKVEDKTFQDIKKQNVSDKIDLKAEMFDYMIGDKTSLRYEYIKSIEDVNERIEQMIILLSDFLPKGLPDEFYDWYARECLGLQYTKFEIKDRKRKYKIQRKRELEKKKQEEKLKKKRLQYTKKNVLITF